MRQRGLDWAIAADHDRIADAMFDAVRHGESPYTDAERSSWMPERRSGADWTARLDRQAIAVARADDAILGFMSLDQGGYIDFAYIRPAARGAGLFRELFGRVEALAVDRGERRLWVHASLMAEPAFAAMGFAVEEREMVAIGNERLRRATMAKELRSASDRSCVSRKRSTRRRP